MFPDLSRDIFFPSRLSLCAAPPIWPSWQHIILHLLARRFRKSFGQFRSSPFVPLVECRPNCKGTSTRSCNSVMPTFTSYYQGISAFPWPGSRNPSPSPVFHHVPMIFFFSSRRRASLRQGGSVGCCWGTAELLPWLLAPSLP